MPGATYYSSILATSSNALASGSNALCPEVLRRIQRSFYVALELVVQGGSINSTG